MLYLTIELMLVSSALTYTYVRESIPHACITSLITDN